MLRLIFASGGMVWNIASLLPPDSCSPASGLAERIYFILFSDDLSRGLTPSLSNGLPENPLKPGHATSRRTSACVLFGEPVCCASRKPSLGPVLTKKKKKSNFLSLIELTLNLIGQKMNNQEDISIFGRGKFDSIHLTKKSKKTKRPTFELD